MTNPEEARQFIENFEYVLNLSELKALLKLSQSRPLTSKQYERVLQLKKAIWG